LAMVLLFVLHLGALALLFEMAWQGRPVLPA
jgi:hypothetical protein